MKTDILIIGGGFGGSVLAQQLEKQGIKTLLVDRKDYFEVTYAALRELADPTKTGGRSRRYYPDILKGSFYQGTISELLPNSAVLEGGETIQFEKAVIASGSKYPSLPIAKSSSAVTLESRAQELAKYHNQLASASNVLVIGGGVVGVELAGEIAYAFPDIDITLAHNGDSLLDGFDKKAQSKALKQLMDLGVKVEFNTYFQEKDSKFIDRESGKVLAPDISFVAVGPKPNNEYLQKNFSQILNSNGFVKVDEYLSVKGQENFYGIGDIADVGEAKLGYLAVEQAKYLARRLAKENKGKHSKPYKRNPFMALVPTGQKTGVVQLPFMVSTLKVLVNIKQKDLFIAKTFKEFNH